MVLLKSFGNIFRISELRKKLLFTLGVLIIDRLGTYIPIIGVNVSELGKFFEAASTLNMVFAYLDTLSGSALGKCTLFALGISPYITASIMMQLLGMTIPSLEQLMKEGEYGRKVINQYTRYLALGLSVFYGLMYVTLLESQGLVLTPGWGFRIIFILSLSAGAMFVMWLGDQISLYGVGNGASMLIFAGIVSRFPDYVLKTINFVSNDRISFITALLILAIFIAVIGCVVFLEKGERKIPVQYARRIVGNKVYGGQSAFIPFKINPAGVMPVIFAGALLQGPMWVVSMLSSRFALPTWVSELVSPLGIFYNMFQLVLIIFFTYFYAALFFDPERLADDMKKSGGFIPGIRPGKKTAQFFDYLLGRISLVGGVYVALLAISPNIMNALIDMPFYMSGTALLIVVSVALETSAQVESYLIEHNYEGFLLSGKLKNKVAR